LSLPEPGTVGHRAKQMVDVPHSPSNRGLNLLEGRKAVPGIELHASLPISANQPLSILDLRRHGDDQRHRFRKRAKSIRILGRWYEEILVRVTATRGPGKIGSVEMRTNDPRPAGNITQEFPAKFEEPQVLIHPGDGAGGRQARCSVPEMTAADRLEGFARAIHEVGAIPTVDVQIDKPRRKISTSQVDGFIPFLKTPPDGCDFSTFHGQTGSAKQRSGQDENSIRENRYRHIDPS
jgi:hypothetical protein